MHVSVPSDLLDILPLTGRSPAMALWRRKTLNIFRGVIELDCTNMTPNEISTLVLETVDAEFDPGVVVPFAFGTVLHFVKAAPDAKSLEFLIDDRARNRGTWQWLIVIDGTTKRAYGIHMWAAGYLTPVFQSTIERCQELGFFCTTIVKQPGKFWKRLWALMEALPKARKIILIGGVSLTLLALALQSFLHK